MPPSSEPEGRGRLCPVISENHRIGRQPDQLPGSHENCRADLAAHHPADDGRSEDDLHRHRTSPQEVSGGRASTARRRTDAADTDLAAVWAATRATFGESAATGRRAGRFENAFSCSTPTRARVGFETIGVVSSRPARRPFGASSINTVHSRRPSQTFVNHIRLVVAVRASTERRREPGHRYPQDRKPRSHPSRRLRPRQQQEPGRRHAAERDRARRKRTRRRHRRLARREAQREDHGQRRAPAAPHRREEPESYEADASTSSG